ncbi:formate dehydrogenase accessory sulfurtransferase FdhD [Aeromicrobium sp. Leaf350]|uniref:formate dehydrogenase accessory sulfurtransferase FdhD n=1 Tax=Aeromicrobium sp. Leaf350 TaxID=2876565 RepID=UPI001E52A0DD|nr:formate dehydrogenase accessory sulfurtransferase FdhD [Aeromicrobium sp. Leaf350]
MSEAVTHRSLSRVTAAGTEVVDDEVAVEAPLEIRVNGRGYAVTMRTPGDDLDLATGFLVSEGVIGSAADLTGIEVLGGGDLEGGEGDVVDVAVAGPGALVAMDRQRHVYTTSSCGVCGLASIDAVRTTSRFDVLGDELRVSPETIAALPDRLREAQAVFDSTGGLHAAGLFGAGGATAVVREDVGRHNAVDKVVGDAVRRGALPLSGHVLQVSGRASFELIQKAAMAGIPVLAAVSAPSSLAVDLADSVGITLVGFSRRGSFNVYTHPQRVEGA